MAFGVRLREGSRAASTRPRDDGSAPVKPAAAPGAGLTPPHGPGGGALEPLLSPRQTSNAPVSGADAELSSTAQVAARSPITGRPSPAPSPAAASARWKPRSAESV